MNLARAGVALAAAALTCSACSTALALTPDPADPAAGPPVQVATNSHDVTGTYPRHCTLTGPGPDPACTPGSVRPDVTQATIQTTICRPGWTATVRPSSGETDDVKGDALAAYGVHAPREDVELDHLVPIELGGSNDVTNLWPEVSDLPGAGFRNSKDTVENTLRREVCAGQVTLAAAQAAIADDWRTAVGRVH